jgi:dimethylamine/trimethylamine dehydrogenase
MMAEDILESGAQNVILATGATWRRDGVGRTLWKPIQGFDLENVITPDDLMDGKQVIGNWVIYDDDHYYMGSVLAELLATNGCNVSLVTPAPMVSYWSQFTLEQEKVQAKLMKLGVKLFTRHVLSEIRNDSVRLSDTILGNEVELPRDGVVLVSDRKPNDEMYSALTLALREAPLRGSQRERGYVRVIGDADAPNIIAQAVFAGHLAAREFDEEKVEGTPFKVERIL